jgi:hypothetical protein
MSDQPDSNQPVPGEPCVVYAGLASGSGSAPQHQVTESVPDQDDTQEDTQE